MSKLALICMSALLAGCGEDRLVNAMAKLANECEGTATVRVYNTGWNSGMEVSCTWTPNTEPPK